MDKNEMKRNTNKDENEGLHPNIHSTVPSFHPSTQIYLVLILGRLQSKKLC